MAIDPSPTAAATRLIFPPRTSPTAKMPRRLVSSRYGDLASGHATALRSSGVGPIERSQAALTQEAQTRAIQEGYGSLSRREREVMALVVAGRLNKQIGGELGISEITVKAHRGKVMRKMEADSLADLVNMAATLHLPPSQNQAAVQGGWKRSASEEMTPDRRHGAIRGDKRGQRRPTPVSEAGT